MGEDLGQPLDVHGKLGVVAPVPALDPVDQLGAEFERSLPRGPISHAPPARMLLVQS